MPMYLPDSALHPIGAEPAEFLEAPDPAAGRPMAPAERAGGSPGRSDVQRRLTITRWAAEYIAGLVENHAGGPEDVRSIIHGLHDEPPIAERTVHVGGNLAGTRG
jgi:hypothetical protein